MWKKPGNTFSDLTTALIDYFCILNNIRRHNLAITKRFATALACVLNALGGRGVLLNQLMMNGKKSNRRIRILYSGGMRIDNYVLYIRLQIRKKRLPYGAEFY